MRMRFVLSVLGIFALYGVSGYYACETLVLAGNGEWTGAIIDIVCSAFFFSLMVALIALCLPRYPQQTRDVPTGALMGPNR